MATRKNTPADPRVARSRRVIIEAAVELLVEYGFAGTTIEAIAARSAVAKTTIYRHWPDKRAVLLAAVEAAVPVATASETGSLRGDLTSFATDLTRIVNTPPTSALIPGLVEAAERDEELAALLAAFTAQRRRPVAEALLRAVERGEAAADHDPELIAALLLGPLFYRRLLSRQPITPEFTDRVVDAVLTQVSDAPPR